ncbi:hypothetical protein HYW73_03785 [Candidatus Nomurabacteria bacterium]|nr:hypothetical protein [Candidatus Nomurabacteria bacterium]
MPELSGRFRDKFGRPEFLQKDKCSLANFLPAMSPGAKVDLEKRALFV